MNRISKLITERMITLGVKEYRVCKDTGIIQQSFNKSLKAENSWNTVIAFFKICRYLGLDPANIALEEKPGAIAKINKKLTEDNIRLKKELDKATKDIRKMKQALSMLNNIK